MAITPQAIKDQEFQVKFRGYDTIEVKAYLDLVAEEFFELLEKVRHQEDEIEELQQQKGLLEELNKNLESDIETALQTTEDIRSECADKDVKTAELNKEIEELQTALADFEEERKDFEEEISAAEGRVSEVEEKLRKSENTIDGLGNKIELLEEQIRELKDEEIDFKRTIGAAQRFADDLRDNARDEAESLKQESEEKAQALLQSSEEKAATALQSARDEIERLRQEAFAELSRLPDEIDQLTQQRNRVRDELRETLTKHMEQLDSFTEADEDVKHYEFDELFQKIDIPENIIAAPALAPVQSEDSDKLLDELSDIDMDLTFSEELDSEPSDENEDEDLRNKLDEGGIAYLSDDS